MLLYHGSNICIETPDLNYGRFNLDFGKGFYVTGLKEQAEKWARRRAAMAILVDNGINSKPIVSVYDFNFDKDDFKILSFKGYTEQWLDFVVTNRGAVDPVTNRDYDIIFGNVANDDVAAVVDDYMRLLSKNRLNPEGKKFFLNQLQYSKPNDQYCLVSSKALDSLTFIKCFNPEEL